MTKTYVSAKLHGLRVTQKSVEYHGSVSIDAALLAAAHIDAYEQVHAVNLNNGARWVTYVIPAPAHSGTFSLNGGGARLGEVDDVCVVMTYCDAEHFTQARVVYCDARNHVATSLTYPTTHDAVTGRPDDDTLREHDAL